MLVYKVRYYKLLRKKGLLIWLTKYIWYIVVQKNLKDMKYRLRRVAFQVLLKVCSRGKIWLIKGWKFSVFLSVGDDVPKYFRWHLAVSPPPSCRWQENEKNCSHNGIDKIWRERKREKKLSNSELTLPKRFSEWCKWLKVFFVSHGEREIMYLH